jgi:hypothetical protein
MAIDSLVSTVKSGYRYNNINDNNSQQHHGASRTTSLVIAFVLVLTGQHFFFGSQQAHVVSTAILRKGEFKEESNVANSTAAHRDPTFVSALSTKTATTTTSYPSWNLIPVDYSWIGKAWAPPFGVPVYNSEQTRNIFERRNVLWFGDSTCRQDWATTWNLMYDRAPKAYAVPNEDVTPNDLQDEININKGKTTEFCVRRDFATNASLYHVLAFRGQQRFLCRNTNSTTKFDLQGSPCYHEVFRLENLEMQTGLNTRTATKFSDEYDVLVVEMGIWEIEREKVCRQHNISNDARMLKSLKAMQRISSPNLTVIWKTAGPSSHKGSNRKRVIGMNDRIRNWFNETAPRHMHLLDFQKQILPRSEGDLRISGDLPPHWGLEARTMSANMLTHALATIFKDR